MPATSTGHLRVAIPGGSTFDLTVKSLLTRTIARLSPVQRQDGQVSYSSYDSRGGVTWDVLARSYLGCGKFLADDGGYGMADGADLRFGPVIPGPRIEADYPGIPGNVKVLGTCTWNQTQFVWTDSATAATSQVFRLESGIWVDRSSGLPAFQVRCMVALGNHVAVGFGVSARYEYMVQPNVSGSWTDNGRAANEPEAYMSVATVLSNDDGAVGARAVYAVQSNTTSITGSNDAGEVFFTTDLSSASAGTLSAGSYVGEGGSASQDDFVSVAVAPDSGDIFFGKRFRLYRYDVAGVVTDAIGTRFDRKTASDDGVSSSVPENFRDPVVMPNGFMYWIVGDYDILEREPINGSFSYKSPRLYGPDTPVMNLPVLAITNIEDELLVALGTTGSGFDVTKFPAGAQLIANTITDGATYLFAGAYRLGPQNEDLGWVYHGALVKLSTMTGFMWYSSENKRLFLSASEAASSLIVLSTQDNLTTVASYTGIALILSAQGTAADTDYWYAASLLPFSGVHVPGMSATNTNAAVVAGEYWNGSAWTSLSVTDTTAVGGQTLRQAGYYSWTVPTAWIKEDLTTIAGLTAENVPPATAETTTDYYFIRFTYNNALDGSVVTSAAVQVLGTVQRVARMVPGNPLTFKMDSQVLLSPDDWTVETGKFIDLRPDVIKTARRVKGQGAGWAADDPKERIYYRVADDDDTATGFVEMAASSTYSSGFTSVANAKTGTAFPDNTEFRGIRLQIKSDDDGAIGEYTYGIVYGVQLQWLDYSDRQQQLEFAFVGSNTNVTPEGVALGEGEDSWKDYITEWQDAKTPATITLLETGYSWPMDLVDGSPVIDYLTNEIAVVAREVVA